MNIFSPKKHCLHTLANCSLVSDSQHPSIKLLFLAEYIILLQSTNNSQISARLVEFKKQNVSTYIPCAHRRLSLRLLGHAVPPQLGFLIIRIVRVCVADEPQVAEHLPQEFHLQ